MPAAGSCLLATCLGGTWGDAPGGNQADQDAGHRLGASHWPGGGWGLQAPIPEAVPWPHEGQCCTAGQPRTWQWPPRGGSWWKRVNLNQKSNFLNVPLEIYLTFVCNKRFHTYLSAILWLLSVAWSCIFPGIMWLWHTNCPNIFGIVQRWNKSNICFLLQSLLSGSIHWGKPMMGAYDVGAGGCCAQSNSIIGPVGRLWGGGGWGGG